MSRVETKRKINSVRITLILTNEGEMVLNTTCKGKNNLLKVLQGSLELIWDAGYVRTMYNRKQKFFNHSDFKNREELDALLSDFLDPYLVKQFA